MDKLVGLSNNVGVSYLSSHSLLVDCEVNSAVYCVHVPPPPTLSGSGARSCISLLPPLTAGAGTLADQCACADVRVHNLYENDHSDDIGLL